MVLIDMEMPKRCGECFNCDRNFNDGEKTIENWMCLLRMRFVGDYVDSGRPQWCPMKPFTPPEPQITTNIYDTEEIHHGCTVQVLRNSVTGDVSVGWWEEKEEKENGW